jgi:hypothetical protein
LGPLILLATLNFDKLPQQLGRVGDEGSYCRSLGVEPKA